MGCWLLDLGKKKVKSSKKGASGAGSARWRSFLIPALGTGLLLAIGGFYIYDLESDRGWVTPPFLGTQIVLLVIVSLLAGIHLYYLARQPELLRREVGACTRELAAASERLALVMHVFENSAAGIMITDAENNILMVNKTFTAVTQYSAEEVAGKNPGILNSGQQDAQFYRALWSSIRATGEWHGEIQNRRKNGELYPEWLAISTVRDASGKITHYCAEFTDLTARRRIEERLNFLAYYDVLTGLPNRILFTDRLDQALIRARRTNRRVAVMFLDLDRFNMVNETFGHSAGDEILKEFAQRLARSVRHGDSVARLGGDQFAIILAELDSPHDTALIAQKTLTALESPFHLAGNEVFVGASIGISLFPEDGAESESLIRNADTALYRAMKHAGNTYRFYTQDMNGATSERIALEAELRHALEREELLLHYQPLVETSSGRIVGAEALLRWCRPGNGLVNPAAFVPLLEETGLIVPVGEWVLRTACIHHRIWREAGHSDLRVAVNFSAQQLHEHDVVEMVVRTTREANCDPRFLEIELTERAMMQNTEDAIATLQRLKARRIQLSLDDFGTGYSSLSYLKRFPLDTLKIDMSFVRDAPAAADAVAIIKAIIAMGHGMNLKILAEGVETREQEAFLRASQCDLMQGYYFSPPLPHGDFLQLIKSGTTMKKPANKPDREVLSS